MSPNHLCIPIGTRVTIQRTERHRSRGRSRLTSVVTRTRKEQWDNSFNSASKLFDKFKWDEQVNSGCSTYDVVPVVVWLWRRVQMDHVLIKFIFYDMLLQVLLKCIVRCACFCESPWIPCTETHSKAEKEAWLQVKVSWSQVSRGSHRPHIFPHRPFFQGCAVGGEEVEEVKATHLFCQPALNIGIPQSTELGK